MKIIHFAKTLCKKWMFLIPALFSTVVQAEEIKSVQTKYLFVLYDAGETLALKGVLDEFEKTGEDFRIVAMGTSAGLTEEFSTKKLELSDIGITEIVDKSWAREKGLSPDDIEKISNAIQAQTVVTGVGSEIQGQILKAYQGKAKTIAYWDNFNPKGAGSYFETAHNVQKQASLVLFPSFFVASSAEFEKRSLLDKRIVGQPTLEIWKKQVERVQNDEVRQRLQLSSKDKVMTFIGGYGPSYEKAFALFVSCVKELNDPKLKVIVQIHPKSDGAFEANYINKKKANLQFILPSQDRKSTTIEAVAIADSVVCYDSTVGFQALSLGKKVLYCIPPKDPARNIAIELGLAAKVSSAKDFAQEMNSSQKVEIKDFYSTFGIPKNSLELILGALSAP